MEKQSFLEFLKRRQGDPIELEKTYWILCPYKEMSFEDFCSFLLSDANSILKKQQNNEDRPLTHFYVHSSHNTYLTGNQITSSSD